MITNIMVETLEEFYHCFGLCCAKVEVYRDDFQILPAGSMSC